MTLSMLVFEGDRSYDMKRKQLYNYTDNSYIYTRTYGVAQVVLAALSPLYLDGNTKLTIKLHMEEDMIEGPGYHCDSYFKVSYFNLAKDTSLSFYEDRKFDKTFHRYVAESLFDILEIIDKENGGRDKIAQRRTAIMQDLENCHFQKEILLSKFSKKTKNRKYASLVYQCLGPNIGEAIRVDIIEQASGNKLVSKWMSNVPGYLQRSSMLKKSYWEGTRFYLLAGCSPKQTYIDISTYI